MLPMDEQALGPMSGPLNETFEGYSHAVHYYD